MRPFPAKIIDVVEFDYGYLCGLSRGHADICITGKSG